MAAEDDNRPDSESEGSRSTTSQHVQSEDKQGPETNSKQKKQEDLNSNRSGLQAAGGTAVNLITTKTWIVSAVVLAICMSYCLLYRKGSKNDMEDPSSEKTVTPEIQTVLKFPGFFKTEVELHKLQEELNKVDRAGIIETCTTIHDSFLPSKDIYPEEEGDREDTASGFWIYHGCCKSRHYFVSPSKAKTPDNEEVTLVQFNDRKQFFSSQHCKTVSKCTGCRCTQEMSLLTAVVANNQYPDFSSDSYILQWIQVPGCCMCINN